MDGCSFFYFLRTHPRRETLSKQVAVLKAIEPVREENVILGQYLGSDDGSQPGYKDGAFIFVCIVV